VRLSISAIGRAGMIEVAVIGLAVVFAAISVI
jgi:hypothetical protein